MELTKEQNNFLTVLGGIKIAHQHQSVWASSDTELLQVAEGLIDRGWILETTPLYMVPGDPDRCFQLTITGQIETGFLTIS